MKKVVIRMLCIALFGALLFSSCASKNAPSGSASPSETPTPEPPPPVNELRDALETAKTIFLPAESCEFLQKQADALQTAISGLGFSLKLKTETVREESDTEETGEPANGTGEPAEGPVEGEGEELPPVTEVHFGRTCETPGALYENLGTADFTIDRAGDKVFVAGGSDYALREATVQVLELLGREEFAFPYTYTAPEKEQVKFLRVATFNIQNGAADSHNFKRMAETLVTLGIDIVGLQEVDMNTTRNGKQDTMQILSELTGLQYYGFSKAIAFGGGEYGTGVLSKYPILSYETIALPGGGGDESRSCGHAVIDVDGVSIDFFNTHLTLADSARGAQWLKIAAPFNESPRAIITGDLNRDGTEDYDALFAETCSFANGNNGIGFEEGCTLVSKGDNPDEDIEAEKEIVKSLYNLKNGRALEGTYTLTGTVTGVVNIYPDSSDVTLRLIVGGLTKKTIRCFKLKGEGVTALEAGDKITVTGTLVNRTYRSPFDDTPVYYDSCPGWGALDNVISCSFFTQMDTAMNTNRRALSDHNLLYADLAYPAYVEPEPEPETPTPADNGG